MSDFEIVSPVGDESLMAILRQEVQASIDRSAEAAHQINDETDYRESTDGQILDVYDQISKRIWKLHHNKLRRGPVGKLLNKAIGRTAVPFDYYADPLTSDLVWGDEDIMIATMPLFEEVSADVDVPAKIGWSFAVTGTVPDAMAGGGPLIAHLLPEVRGVSVVRVATALGTGERAREEWYSIFKRSNDKLGFYASQAPNNLEEMFNEIHTGEKSLAAQADEAPLKLHALGLGQQALTILEKAY